MSSKEHRGGGALGGALAGGGLETVTGSEAALKA